MLYRQNDIVPSCFAAVLLTSLLGGCVGGTTTNSSTPTTPTQVVVTTPPVSTTPEVDWFKKNAQPFTGTDPALTDDSDLKKFGDAIGDARIVALAEPDHGSGTIFDMKTRLVKYLHEKKGFDVLLIESGGFAVDRVWQQVRAGQKLDDVAPDNIFYMYSKSVEGRKVLQYVDAQRNTANPMIVGPQHGGIGTGATNETNEFVPMLTDFLKSRGSQVLATESWTGLKYILEKAIFASDGGRSAPELLSKSNLAYDATTKLKAELCGAQTDTYVFPTSPGIWCNYIKSIDNAIAAYLEKPSLDPEARYAEDFKWLEKNLYPNKKIILWGHYQHLGKGTQLGYDSVFPDNLGNAIGKAFGKNYYVVAFTVSAGSELVWWDGVRSIAQLPVDTNTPGSVEDILAQLNKPYLFVDSRASAPPASVSKLASKASNFLYAYRNIVNNTTIGNAYDGLFYIETSKAAVINRY